MIDYKFYYQGKCRMEFQLSDKAKDYIARTKAFIQTEIETY